MNLLRLPAAKAAEMGAALFDAYSTELHGMAVLVTQLLCAAC